MAVVDPYAPCPCGSGEKFKWCCQKVEAQAERAQRLFESGQIDAALQAIDEGLRKEPRSAWLLSRKALYLLRQQKFEPAKSTLRLVLEHNPKHLGALMLLTRLVMETEGAVAGVGEFQRALAAFPPEGRVLLSGLARVVGAFLSEAAEFPAALKHLELARRLAPNAESRDYQGTRLIESSPTVSPWQKNPYKLSPAPSTLEGPALARFDEALQSANQGLWAAAATAFAGLADAAVEAERNLGLCHIWLANRAGAADALGRAIGRMGATDEAVDLEALRQQILPMRPDDLVEHVQLIWSIRDREALLAALRADERIEESVPEPLDADDPDSPDLYEFALLDRDPVAARSDLRIEEVPRVVARVLVGPESVALDTYDDGRLDGLSDRLLGRAGSAIPAAHPKTKVLEKVARHTLALSWDWLIPEGTDPDTARRLNREQGVRFIHEVWPETPIPALGNRTPLQAAEFGNAVVPLRAAVFQLEVTRESWRADVDFPALRARLRIEAEPEIDPETVDVDALHLARLTRIPVERLNDDRLAKVYIRARATALTELMERTARTLVGRPDSWERIGIPSILFHSDLATAAFGQGRIDEAFDWLRRGRQADTPAQRLTHGPTWDMLEIRFRAQTQAPEQWVPELAITIQRYRDDQAATQGILQHLIEMGLVEVKPNPDRPDDVLLDTRMLQGVLAEYGPRITTSSGELGVSATKGGLWTPGGAQGGGGGGGLWTPGSSAGAPPAGSEKPRPKLIVPGG